MTIPGSHPRSAMLERLTLSAALLCLVWAPLAQGSTFGWGQSGLILLGALTWALLGLTFIWTRSPVPAPIWRWAAWLLLGWIWLSVTWSPDTQEAIRWAGSWSALLGAALAVERTARTPGRRSAVMGTLALTAGLAVASAVLQLRGIRLPGFTTLDPRQLSGPYFNPSHFSGFLIGSAALLTSLLVLQPYRTRLARLWSLPVLIVLVGLEFVNLHTDSSSIPAVLLATALPLLALIWTRSRAVGLILTVLALAAGVGVITLFFTPQGQALFAREQTRIGIHRDWSSFLKQRRAVWHYGEAMVRAQPLHGVGIGQFQNEAARYRREERKVGSSMDSAGVNYAHNDALQMASELGLPGAVLFAAVLLLPLFARQKAPSSLQRPSARFPGGFARLTWWSALPPLLLAGLYDAHLTAIPGTAAGMLALAALATGSALRPEPSVTEPEVSGQTAVST